MTKHIDMDSVLNDIIEEKHSLWQALDNLVELWDMEASMNDIEKAMIEARQLRDALKQWDY
jgi:hypothetical protein